LEVQKSSEQRLGVALSAPDSRTREPRHQSPLDPGLIKPETLSHTVYRLDLRKSTPFFDRMSNRSTALRRFDFFDVETITDNLSSSLVSRERRRDCSIPPALTPSSSILLLHFYFIPSPLLRSTLLALHSAGSSPPLRSSPSYSVQSGVPYPALHRLRCAAQSTLQLCKGHGTCSAVRFAAICSALKRLALQCSVVPSSAL
jgi:hypothetical protein